MASLEKQVVLVTGCSTGIGRALVKELKARGHRPFATARKLESIADLAREGIETARLDVEDPDSIAAAVAAVRERAGRIDVLINNAGQNVFGPMLEVPVERVRKTFEVNVLGLLSVSQAVFPVMAAQRSGLFVNVGSVVGILPTPFAGGYCASKSAVHMLSEVIRIEAAPFGIGVVVVQPGGVKSSIADGADRQIEQFKSESSLYRDTYEGIHRRAHASQDGPMPAEDFARELVDRAFVDSPPRVVRLGTGSNALPRLAELPPEQRDSLLSAQYGLDALRR